MGMVFTAWLTSRRGKDTIASYKVDGEQLSFPNYVEPRTASHQAIGFVRVAVWLRSALAGRLR